MPSLKRAPTILLAILLLSPFPSLLALHLDYHPAPVTVILALLPPLSLAFSALSALIVCIARNPGLPRPLRDDDEEDECPLDPLRWCPTCIAPKPERAHHCSSCDRCVLKMDHHCVWLGTCVGYRTHPAFVHLLATSSLLAFHAAALGVFFLYNYFYAPFILDERTTFHALFIALAGSILTLVTGSFAGYHLYLILTNQTTIEQMSYYHLLSFLPTLPGVPEPAFRYPPKEHQLTYTQRRLIRKAHSSIRPYSLGWRENYRQVYSSPLLLRLWYGGRPAGDGYSFLRNPEASSQLAKLVAALQSQTDDR